MPGFGWADSRGEPRKRRAAGPREGTPMMHRRHAPPISARGIDDRRASGETSRILRRSTRKAQAADFARND